MDTYLTELLVTKDYKWAGPDIKSESFEGAERQIAEFGIPATIVGKLFDRIEIKEGWNWIDPISLRVH